ncbi:hypothetical protein AQUCO_00900514v1 [Aquilegia coerulea]|uniref:Uncharacterized protein n=1 Tax=Aquilegia coerulea TaxID=218851 RepID=A0A2G5EE25_AQUCA|nr:hypothetical protein AQUCO_00900514v1 [Aquilegia coerulea]
MKVSAESITVLCTSIATAVITIGALALWHTFTIDTIFDSCWIVLGIDICNHNDHRDKKTCNNFFASHFSSRCFC